MAEDNGDYFEAAGARARALGNRGPLRFGADGRLATEIRDAFEDTGFYVFEGVIDAGELAELDAQLSDLLDRTPRTEGATTDRRGRPLDADAPLPQLLWARPLADPWGGTDLLNGRHQVRMEEPQPDAAAPDKAIFLILGLFETMDSAFRLSAHPDVLRAAESLCGPGFVPYNDTIFLKEPGLGASIAWHQDGTTHWDSPAWRPDIHGVNFMAQLRRTTPANALWVVPGSHRDGHIDIRARVAANGGSTRLPDAVPMLCARGDVAVQNRQCLHGSFANASPDPRITFVWGFFPRDAVLDVETQMPATGGATVPGTRRYTSDVIRARERIVQLAIEARREARPDETPYALEVPPAAPLDADARRRALRGYARGTIFI
ncbi:MAG TPA: phytanoyl-CoA dioxygenase family protein [Pseudomonadales bacterium]|nr:phytanoyl-CoA dioxygenase family protein [Pseudomonadales bacterium]